MAADPRIAQFQQEVEKVLQFLHAEFAKLQTGRASAALVEGVIIDAYDQRQPLKAVAGIGIQDARTITVQPWDRSIMANVEKALQNADLGSNPVNDGTMIRITLPPMTQERRTQLTKVVQTLSEEGRITVRQKRQDLQDRIKTEEKDEDAKFTLLEQLQKEVESVNKQIDEIREKKEEEVMTV